MPKTSDRSLHFLETRLRHLSLGFDVQGEYNCEASLQERCSGEQGTARLAGLYAKSAEK